MPKLKRLSAAEVVSILKQFGFAIHDQNGSHLKLRRVLQSGEKQTLTVPNHRQLDTGTCHAIFRQACKYITADELRRWFYSDN
jgi:predicted RNA binding protein YcfA (HicA-like mRNA interferase family)